MLEYAASFGSWATAVGAVATIGLLVAAVAAGITATKGIRTAAAGVEAQIQEQREIEKRRRVFTHLGTFSSHDFTAMTIDAVEVIDTFADDTRGGETYWKGIGVDRRTNVMTLLNFYELVATEYNEDALDRKLANTGLAYVAIVMWERAVNLITYLRGKNEAYFAQWAMLYDRDSKTIIAAEAASRATKPGAS